jgi:eukaryotic-like serine/threonine-protein kinase
MGTGSIADNTIMPIQDTYLLYLLMVMPVLLLPSAIITQIASAQTNDGIFLTYQSHTYGFKIQYPSNWEKLEFAQGIEEEHRNIVVNFLSPAGEGTSNTFREYLIIEVENSTSHDESLTQYVATQINLRQALPNFNLVESTLTSVSGGNPAHKIVYTYSNPIVGITKAMDILTIKSDKLYFLSYNADTVKYSRYLPIIQKVIDSFQIIK